MEPWKILALGAGVVAAMFLGRTVVVRKPQALPATSDGSWPASTRPYAHLTYASNRVNITGLRPSVLQRFLAMSLEYTMTTKKKLHVTSALRSTAHQKIIYDRDVASSTTPTGAPKKVGVPSGYAAKPGSSPHEKGIAIDVSSAQATELDKLGLLKKYGFYRPLWPKGRAKVTEEWHIQALPETVS